MYIKTVEPAGVVWSSFMAPFSADIWVAVAVSMATIPTLLSVADTIWRHYGNKNGLQTTFIQTLLYSFGAFFFQG
jgi:hypothetical protein